MRIVGDIEHPRLKITVFKNDGRFSLKFENGLLEQTYKFRDDQRLTTVDDVKSIVDQSFTEKIEEILRGMHEAKMDAMSRNLPSLDDAEFPKII